MPARLTSDGAESAAASGARRGAADGERGGVAVRQVEHPAAPLVLTHYQRASSGVSLPGGTPPAGPARRRVLDWFRELAACTALVLAHRTVQAYLISAHPLMCPYLMSHRY